MKRFYICVASIFLLLTFLSAGAVVVGRVQPQPEVIRGLGICDNVPCYRGISADKTSWNDALSFLRRTTTAIRPDFPGIAPVQGTLGFERYDFQDGSIHMSLATYDTLTISWLTLTFLGATPPKLGDFIATEGIPCKVVYQAAPNTIVLYFPYPTTFAIGFHLSQPAVPNPNSEVETVTLIRNAGDICRHTPVSSWHGFGLLHQ